MPAACRFSQLPCAITQPQASKKHEHYSRVLPRHEVRVIHAVHRLETSAKLVDIPAKPTHDSVAAVSEVRWVLDRRLPCSPIQPSPTELTANPAEEPSRHPMLFTHTKRFLH